MCIQPLPVETASDLVHQNKKVLCHDSCVSLTLFHVCGNCGG